MHQVLRHTYKRYTELLVKKCFKRCNTSYFRCFQKYGTLNNDHIAMNNLRIPSVFLMVSISIPFLNKKITETDDEASSDNVIVTLKRARLAEMKGDYPAAQEFYHRALALLTADDRKDSWSQDQVIQAKIYIYDNLANLAFTLQEYRSAESLYIETMRGLLQQGSAKDDDAIIEISLKLSMIYAATGRRAEADTGYQYCIDVQEKKLSQMKNPDDNSVALLGMAADAYSKFLVENNQPHQALKYIDRALVLAERVFGKDHPQTAVLYNDRGTLCSLLKQTDEAEKSFKQAIQSSSLSNTSDLSTFHYNLAMVYCDRNLFTPARLELSKALNYAKNDGDQLTIDKIKAALRRIPSS